MMESQQQEDDMEKLIRIQDGIWQMYYSPDWRVWVTQYGRKDWRVCEYAGRFGSRKLREYVFPTKHTAMEFAKTL